MENMIVEGLRLMGVGMTVVFLVLAILVATMQLSARFFTAFADYFPEEPSDIEGLADPEDDLLNIAIALAAIRARQT